MPLTLRRPSRALVAVVAAVAMLAVYGVPADARPSPRGPATTPHEIWMLDQGTDLVHVHASDGHEEVATIDLRPQTLRDAGFVAAPSGARTVPHMIDFDSQHRYAFVAATAGGVTIVLDARTKEVVEVLPTGAGSHMAAVTPDDAAVWVAVIAERKLVEIPLQLDAADPAFAIGEEVELGTLLADVEAEHDWTYPSYSPVCHQYSPDSTEAWITLGPGWDQGGLVVLDLTGDERTISHAYDPDVVKANCGISVTEDRAVANWSGRIVEGGDTDGETYVFDRRTKEPLATIAAEGVDTHGLRLTPDGRHYWQVNRQTDDALVIDARSLRVVHRVEDVADAPDIIDYSPDGKLVYITQRGPSPRSGAIHAAAGQQPGVAVVHAASRRTLAVIEPPRAVAETETGGTVVVNDVHGVGVRPLARGEEPGGKVRTSRVQPLASTPAVREVAGTAGFHCGLPAA
jgi:DNA-binding beta-propeller fold protein YncE